MKYDEIPFTVELCAQIESIRSLLIEKNRAYGDSAIASIPMRDDWEIVTP